MRPCWDIRDEVGITLVRVACSSKGSMQKRPISTLGEKMDGGTCPAMVSNASFNVYIIYIILYICF